jgi:hypothetical protein
MKVYDLWSSLFWLLLSIYVCIESIRLGIGKPSEPDMGFMTFGASVILGIFSLILLARSLLKRKEVEITSASFGSTWKRPLVVMIALIVYGILLPFLGYLICTFLLMSYLFWLLKGTKWWLVLSSSFLATIGTYYIFSKLLSCNFPEGLFRL